jgi:hypothetical protein
MEYKGFKFRSYGASSNGRMKGLAVNLYNNDNGTYGFIEHGKDFGYTKFDENIVSDEVEELIIKIAVDKSLSTGEIHEKDFVAIKFSSDFLLGVIATTDLLSQNK